MDVFAIKVPLWSWFMLKIIKHSMIVSSTPRKMVEKMEKV